MGERRSTPCVRKNERNGGEIRDNGEEVKRKGKEKKKTKQNKGKKRKEMPHPFQLLLILHPLSVLSSAGAFLETPATQVCVR